MWKFAFVLPNITIQRPYEYDFVALVPSTDFRVEQLKNNSLAVRALMNSFTDQFQRAQSVSAILIADNAPASIDKTAILAFRNAFALSCIFGGLSSKLHNSSSFVPIHSDYFDLYPIVPHGDQRLVALSPALMGLDDAGDFKGQTSPGVPSMDVALSDEWDSDGVHIFGAMKRAWRRRFVSGRLEWRTRVLFRSLEIAYQACSMPIKNFSTLYDYGSSIALWVSALEILSHPSTSKAGLKTVSDLLASFPWHHPVLRRRRFIVKRDRNRAPLIRGNLAVKLYAELYDARNRFLHGERVTQKQLFPFGEIDRHPLTAYAIALYEAAVCAFLNVYRFSRASLPRQVLLLWSVSKIEDQILTAR